MSTSAVKKPSPDPPHITLLMGCRWVSGLAIALFGLSVHCMIISKKQLQSRTNHAAQEQGTLKQQHKNCFTNFTDHLPRPQARAAAAQARPASAAPAWGQARGPSRR